ncbi:MAG: hypothetical protein Unbinned4834contig1000_56 [Prokaryotic dsDNA virus sp.]|nr:MAG: hypothetical protein Unbinned4834contig1000_56 [Prokaryotic dsDNA virus sp.]|tara:strand:- start:16664 stop:17044 length:381 start_codon:yes stop_codon:yes gene_type:complete
MALQLLVGPIANLAKSWMDNRHEQSQAKHKAKMEVISNTASWEEKMAEASANSWKDEFWTVILSIPLLCVGYSIVVGDPDILMRVADGFHALDTLPDWYQYLLFLAVSASFGVRGASKLMKLRNAR